ncbi:hypothetical protein IB680_05675 [Francisella philomiragia]|uniref:hypothetical protein n=1 Tax=Francisella philomiragia TaxID=28110 RepID=UPI000B59204C|nr:hypothetical protein [Francisella philomiragia]MBK2095163.1 hypothetical protein [Francisella philomiragia]
MSKIKKLAELTEQLIPTLSKNCIDLYIEDILKVLSKAEHNYTKNDAIAIFCWFFTNIHIDTNNLMHKRLYENESNDIPLMFKDNKDLKVYFYSLFVINCDKYYTYIFKPFLKDLVSDSDRFIISNIKLNKIDYSNLNQYCYDTLFIETDETNIIDIISAWSKVDTLKKLGRYVDKKDFPILKEITVDINYTNDFDKLDILGDFEDYKYPHITPSDLFILLHHRLLAYTKWLHLGTMIDKTITPNNISKSKNVMLNKTSRTFLKTLITNPMNARVFGEDHKVLWSENPLGNNYEKSFYRASKAPHGKKVNLFNNLAILMIKEHGTNTSKLTDTPTEFKKINNKKFMKRFNTLWNDGHLLKYIDAFIYREMTGDDNDIMNCVKTKKDKSIKDSRYKKYLIQRFNYQYLSDLAFYYDKNDVTIDLQEIYI